MTVSPPVAKARASRLSPLKWTTECPPTLQYARRETRPTRTNSKLKTQTLILAMLILEALVFATILCGFLGIILKKNLIMKIISMDVMSTGVIAFYVFIAARSGIFTPILTDEMVQSVLETRADSTAGSAIDDMINYADPVPQAVILTAIVIGFSIQALMLVGVMKLAKDNPTLEIDEIEKTHSQAYSQTHSPKKI